MTACTYCRSCSNWLKMGIKKVCVFPEPVCDWPTTSLPCKIAGINFAWTGVGLVKPILVNAIMISGFKLNCPNWFAVSAINFLYFHSTQFVAEVTSLSPPCSSKAALTLLIKRSISSAVCAQAPEAIGWPPPSNWFAILLITIVRERSRTR